MDDLTFTTVTYERKTWAARYQGHVSEWAAYEYARGWEAMGHGRVHIRSSVRLEHHFVPEKECGETGCRHCPVVVKEWSTISFHAFEGVRPEHRHVVEQLGGTRPVVEAIVASS